MILKLLIGVVMRFKGYMLIGTLLWWDGGMFSDDGMGLPLAWFEVVLSSDDLQIFKLHPCGWFPIQNF
jgi:hypothetical protein